MDSFNTVTDTALPPPTVTNTITAAVESTSSGSSCSPATSPLAFGQKLRLMCSYGGHIVPRPLDKTLCYAGGETRIVAIDRRNVHSLSNLISHLSKSLMDGKQFSLKYQLPNHDLDSLISISTEEDLVNMIDEYDRLAGAATPSRLRFFLFPLRSDHELHDPTSEDWFIDALRNVGVVAKEGLSDSGEAQGDSDGNSPKGASGGVVDSPISLPESIPLEKNSSFGSTSSSASTSNSPAIRGGGDENLGVRLPTDFKIAVSHVDSLGSDSSTLSPNYSPHGVTFQDASNFVESKVISTNLVETESNTPERSPRGDMLTQVPVPSYILTKPMEQQQMAPPQTPQATYIHQSPPSQSHYITQYYPGSVPVASYATMYQPYVQPQQTVQYQVNNPPQPVYMMSVGQAQSPYDRPIQNTLPTAPALAPTMVAAAPMGPAKVFLAPAMAAQSVNVSPDAFPPSSQAASAVAAAPLECTNYIGEFEDPLHARIYKTQPPGTSALPSQLQVQTNAGAATVMLSETLAQLQIDNSKQ